MAKVALSIDGDQATTDAIRGIGVHEKVMSAFKKLKQSSTGEQLCARITYDASSVRHLYDNIKHLHKAGFFVIDSAPDLWDQTWSETSIDTLRCQWTSILHDEELMSGEVKLPELVTRGRSVRKGGCDGGTM